MRSVSVRSPIIAITKAFRGFLQVIRNRGDQSEAENRGDRYSTTANRCIKRMWRSCLWGHCSPTKRSPGPSQRLMPAPVAENGCRRPDDDVHA
ncbi:hypothetical protein EVAR_23235_1 [Eumeta japonica]|uniref:Uncharacterized protein n=1 Tax=Eumeta variegata TaxID=151549 RepID=A0A4C1VEA3_EUMVA|nr:hypothetical protein EVAR_23235_1 [Eumeta japonica]